MDKKIVFLDIDGTLVEFSGNIPDSSVKAIKKAKENGHLIYICSGRSRYQIHPQLKALGFDGYVLAAGSHVICNNKTIFHKFIEPDAQKRLICYLEKNNFTYDIQTDEYAVFNKRCFKKAMDRFEKMELPKEQVDILIQGAVIRENVFNCERAEKVVYSDSTIGLHQIQKDLAGDFTITASSLDGTSDSGEIGIAGVDKSTGMEKCLKYLGIERKNCLAFGDGHNDFEMIEYAGIGVAMGNAIDELKKKADYVTTNIHQDGIYNAFKKFGLI